jgi:hypothetical protein
MKTKTASVFTKSVRMALVTLAGVGAVAALSCQSAIAQTSEQVNPLEEFQNPDATSDPFSNRGGTQSGIYDWIHRAVLGNPRSQEEFRAEQQESLNDAASEFRRQQLEVLKQRESRQNQQNPTSEAQPQTQP